MESSKFPKAIVKGKLKDFSVSKLNDGVSNYTLEGTITIHGVTKPFETSLSISKKGDSLHVESQFVLNPTDFNIEIPKIVSNKIADEVNVNAKYSLLR